MTALIETHYLPSVAYFASLYKCKEILIEKYEHYRKQSYRNRCHIITPQGLQPLIIPVLHTPGKVLISDVRIDHTQKWVNNHWRAIQSGYGKAPFFEHYADDLQEILYRKSSFLYDLNMEILSMCLNAIRSDIAVKENVSYSKKAENGVLDLRNTIDPKNQERMEAIFTPVPYTQVFGSSFVANASIIDLIFCVGPEAARIVEASGAAN